MSWEQAEQTARETASEMLAALPEEVRVPIEGTGQYLIKQTALDQLTEVVQLYIAELVSSIIDAGSERDAVMENNELRRQIRAELHGWSDDVSINLTGF